MRRGRLLADARRGVEGLTLKKDNRNKDSNTALQRCKCSYVASECEEKVQGLEKQMGSLHTEVKGLRAQVSAMHKVTPAWWSNAGKHFLEESFKNKLASLQEEMKGVRADSTASLRDTSAICEILNPFISHVERLSSLAELDKKVTELRDDVANMDGHMQGDVTSLITMDQQLEQKMDSMQEEMTELRADVAKHAEADASSVVMLTKKIDLLQQNIAGELFITMQEEMNGLRTDMEKVWEYMTALGPLMATMGSVDRLKVEMIGLRADMAKRYGDMASPPVIKEQLLPIALKIDNSLRELQGLHARAAMTYEKETACTANMENFQTDLSTRMCEAVKRLYVDMMAVQFRAIEGDGKVQMDLLNKMHAEMEQIMLTMNRNASWNAIAQEKSNMKIQELMDTLLSNLESHTTDEEQTDKKCADIILVKTVSAFLVCTTAFYAWIVWNSYYPL